MSTTYYQLERLKRTAAHEDAVAALLRHDGLAGFSAGDAIDVLNVLDEAMREAQARVNFDRFIESLGPTGKPAHGHACIHRVLGEQCHYGRAGVSVDRWTECRVPDADHDSLWYRNGKPYVYVSQPYGSADDVRLPRWRAWAAEKGLELEFLPDDSWWSPGGTVLLLFKRVDLT
jgi:hypothetical protein